jgi:hypothetical protein
MNISQAWWLTSIIPTSWEAEIRRIAVTGIIVQPGKKTQQDSISTNKLEKAACNGISAVW